LSLVERGKRESVWAPSSVKALARASRASVLRAEPYMWRCASLGARESSFEMNSAVGRAYPPSLREASPGRVGRIMLSIYWWYTWSEREGKRNNTHLPMIHNPHFQLQTHTLVTASKHWRKRRVSRHAPLESDTFKLASCRREHCTLFKLLTGTVLDVTRYRKL